MIYWQRTAAIISALLLFSSFQKIPHAKLSSRHIDPATHWVDSVFNSLNEDERIAQLIMVRAHSNLGADHVAAVARLIRENKIGGLVFFQGGPERQAALTNYYQSISKVPLFIGIDAEWGLGMRLDSVISFPRQMQLGAMSDSTLVYEMGKAVGEQCRRMGIQINFAPVADINNNPDNPVINDRSFGENKYKVAAYSIAYMKGLQDAGIIAVGKHFPGHGDTNADSHKSLPEINKSMAQLDSLELYPFRQMIHAGIKGMMVAHLYIPSIDSAAHLPTSLSHNNVTTLLKQKLGFKGLVFTDALEMKGVTRYFDHGDAEAKALQAGNDILLLPESVPAAIYKIKWALNHHQLNLASVYQRVKKVLLAKYKAGLYDLRPVDTGTLTEALNARTIALKKQMDEKSVTVLSNEDHLLPLDTNVNKKIAYIGIGIDSMQTDFANYLQQYRSVAAFYFTPSSDWTATAALVQRLKYNYDAVIIGVHNYSRFPANNFGFDKSELLLISQLQEETRAVTIIFGNPYAIRNFDKGSTIISAYDDDSLIHETVARLLFGQFIPGGRLPVSISNRFPAGSGLNTFRPAHIILPYVPPAAVNMDTNVLKRIDTIAAEAISQKATPGCVVLGMRNGKIFLNKAYGYTDYNETVPVTLSTIYDLASCTKICATTMAIMRLYDEGRLDIHKTLGSYLPWLKGSDKARLIIKDVLLHQAGLVAWIPFYRETLYDGVHPDTLLYSPVKDPAHTVRVAENLYMKADYIATMFKLIRDSRLGPARKYVYSDNDFILMQKVVEAITGMSLDEYVEKTFYDPLGMLSTGFRPRSFAKLERVAPTEKEPYFRLQQLHGDVHDPGAAMFGGVSGHAGLFSDTYDLAILMQMLLNGGSMEGVQYIKPGTIRYFTAYQSNISRRGLAWDKPEKEKERMNESDPYPCKSASSATFGHTGYTGTCIWVDPVYDLVYIFLSNRVCPDGGENRKLNTLNIRSRIQETMYEAMGVK